MDTPISEQELTIVTIRVAVPQTRAGEGFIAAVGEYDVFQSSTWEAGTCSGDDAASKRFTVVAGCGRW